jgi:hypothetical protein
VSASPHIEAIRAAFLAKGGHVGDLVAFLLDEGEIDQMIGQVIEAQVSAGWSLIPPGIQKMLKSDNLRGDLLLRNFQGGN